MGEGRFTAAVLLFTDASLRVEDPFLARALSLAERGRGMTAPNPVVGCVIVRDGRVVGEGFHPRAGQPHAEVFALADAGELARGADVYVTLEPCSHHGRTPSCAEALISAGVRSVRVGLRDPNPEARGGAELLSAAGIDVRLCEDPEPFASINSGWLKRVAVGLPAVTVKVGASLDGSTGLRPGAPASMTGAHGAEVTARLRARVDAVLVGASTVAADDPELTVRDRSGRRREHQPLRVVLCRSVVPALDSRIFTDGCAPTLLLVPEGCARPSQRELSSDVSVHQYDGSEGLRGALRALGNHGINDVLIEAGPRLLSGFIRSDAIDTLVVVTGGGFAGTAAPRMADVAGDSDADVLDRRFIAVESAIVGDVAATVWERSSVYAGA